MIGEIMANNIIYVIPRNRKLQKTRRVKSIHQSLKFLLILAQIFALFPVEGISNQDVAALKFRWMSWKTIYSLLFAFSLASLLTIQVLTLMKDGFFFLDTAFLFYFVSVLITVILFLKLAMKWPNLMRKWVALDESYKFGKPPELDLRLKTMTTIVLLIAVVEYSLTTVNRWLVRRNKCHTVKSTRELIDEFLITNAAFGIFKSVNYSMYVGLFSQILRILANFAWAFIDLFIGIIGTLIALRFKQFNTYVEDSIKNKIRDTEFWRNVREDYNKLSFLTKMVNDSVSNIVLLSYVCNLYFILIQLFNTQRYTNVFLLQIYYYASFFVIIMRTVWVSVYVAWINDESKYICHILKGASSKVYNSEISRLIDQAHFTEVALTGMNFFYVTRGIILSMAGAIVTYELALLQFNANLLYISSKEIDKDC